MHDHFPRGSGVLLHPTSLPGRLGVGNLGEPARRFVDWLVEAGQSLWQVLPLGPTSYGDSPYQTLSAFAGNPLLIDPCPLVDAGWLATGDLSAIPAPPDGPVDFGAAIGLATKLLDRAHAGFRAFAPAPARAAYEEWCRREAAWLDDWGLFTALKERNGGRPWTQWPAGEARRDPATLEVARAELSEDIDRHRFRQWLFHEQCRALRDYARARGVRLFGDIPIFVAHDSADVWANPSLFRLAADGLPTAVAGVPPDYFSATGQRWGNPIYDWDAMRERGWDWWIARLRASLAQVDLVRIDHFRGFAACWEIPAGEPTAVRGRWAPGPGAAFFRAVREALGALPIVAEDLGIITPEVEGLREEFGLPGMKVLQFAWSDPLNPFLPHAHVPNCVVYTGTHDNNTTVGWWREEAGEPQKRFLAAYFGRSVGTIGRDPHWTLIRVGMMSPAHTFIAPMQDLLGLGSEARLNTPAAASGNWTWRLPAQALDSSLAAYLIELTRLYRRHPDQQGRGAADVHPAPAP